MRKLKKVGRVIYWLVVCLVSLAIIASVVARITAESMGVQPNLFGYTPTIVVSGSMLPTIQVDSLNIIKDTNFDEVEVGDIVVYWSTERRINILHRVVDIDYTSDGVKYFTTQGDANPAPDNIQVTSDLYRGEVVATFNWLAPFLDDVVQNGVVNTTELLKVAALAVLVLWAALSAIYYLIGVICNSFLRLVKKGGQYDGL